MSIQAVAWALDQHIPDPGAKLVLLSLCNAYNGDRRACFPSHARIATEASCSRRTVIRKLDWLEENGWISSIPRFDTTGRTQSNLYSIHMDNEGVSLSPRCDTAVTGEGVTGDTGEGVNCVTPLKGTVRSIVTKNRNEVGVSTPAPADWAFAEFCNLVHGSSIPAPRKLTADRKRKIEARLKEHGLETWLEACTKLSQSAFCNGSNDRGWIADLDFLCQPKSFNRLIEGGYDNRTQSGGGGQESDLQRISRMIREMLREETMQ